MLWGARLSGFLLFRILKTQKDDRFDNMRGKFFSFLGFWVAQMVWVWTVSLPVTILNSPNVTKYVQPNFETGCDIAGCIMFAIGFLLESVSDVQKYLFRSNPDNKGKVCDVGFFAWSRHPNYFGEILIQFGKLLFPYLPKGTRLAASVTKSLAYPPVLSTRNFHNCCYARRLQLRHGSSLSSPLRNNPRSHPSHHPASVR